MSGWQPSGYTPVRPLGAGASGSVVLATHDATGTPVAPTAGVTVSRTGTTGRLAFSSRPDRPELPGAVAGSAIAEPGAEPPTVATAAAALSVPMMTLRR